MKDAVLSPVDPMHDVNFQYLVTTKIMLKAFMHII